MPPLRSQVGPLVGVGRMGDVELSAALLVEGVQAAAGEVCDQPADRAGRRARTDESEAGIGVVARKEDGAGPVGARVDSQLSVLFAGLAAVENGGGLFGHRGR